TQGAQGTEHQNLIADERLPKSATATAAIFDSNTNRFKDQDHLEEEEVILATAHIDTVAHSPGADDNASGIATLMAIGRAVARAPTASASPSTSRTRVRLIAFGLEEGGFIGSRHYVRSLTPRARRQIRAVYNFDMVAFARSGDGTQAWPAEADVMADLRGQRP